MTDESIEGVRRAMQRHLVHAVLGNDRVAREHGLLSADLQVLHLLVLREDVRTPKQISEVTGTPASTVTKLVDRLETAGYVRRTPDHADRRRTRIEPIPEAIEALHVHYARADDEFDEMSSAFSADELAIVRRYLDAATEFYTRQATTPSRLP
ncbi:MarR family transcriptional regulator [Pseudoclavibacter chungangensis]|uniref:MarR family transcriptional regulator n=1 Tax=Pseudoclavibacter chungangensis TaxID=587635 RepID=A0A7J5BR45_9MICO|nr:MarR family transcriptional regulator [Pseudoclavibacter chungangensis]KAB1655987.1 MarR family transcriptional regulator [Pseudoclavibacter chungangensis]NYJ66434.1 DNA-binding MarR family transcriptional regulator [Pseudoclavibacter chungangensis]